MKLVAPMLFSVSNSSLSQACTHVPFLCLSLSFRFWVISRQVTLSNGLGSVQSNYTGTGLTSDMPSPQGARVVRVRQKI